MTEAGLKIYEFRKESKSKIYAHEKEYTLSPEIDNLFKENKAAWAFFERQAPSHKKQIIHWIMSAKQEKTQLSRLEKAISEYAQKNKIKFIQETTEEVKFAKITAEKFSVPLNDALISILAKRV